MFVAQLCFFVIQLRCVSCTPSQHPHTPNSGRHQVVDPLSNFLSSFGLVAICRVCGEFGAGLHEREQSTAQWLHEATCRTIIRTCMERWHMGRIPIPCNNVANMTWGTLDCPSSLLIQVSLCETGVCIQSYPFSQHKQIYPAGLSVVTFKIESLKQSSLPNSSEPACGIYLKIMNILYRLFKTYH